MIPKKNKKLEAVINTCVSIIEWKMMAEIPQEYDFLTCSIQNFQRKVKQFVIKHYITWLIDLANNLYDIEEFLISFYAICY